MLESVHGGSAAKAGREGRAERRDALAAALLDAAAEARAALTVESQVKAVHELRKAFKRLRALLRLVRRETAGRAAADTARALRRRLGEAARRLSGARDVAARREAIEDLAARGLVSPAICRQATALLAPRRRQAGLAAHRAELGALIASGEESALRLAAVVDPARLVRAIARGYADARRLAAKVDLAEPETLHDLRKAVVAHRYQMALVTPAWPAVGRAWEGELQRLREKLGAFQDLSVLLERLGPPGEGASAPLWQPALAEAACARQARLAGAALRLHGRLFAETPKHFARRLAAYFDHVSDRE